MGSEELKGLEAQRAEAEASEAAFRRRPRLTSTFYVGAGGEVRVRIEFARSKDVIDRAATDEELAAWKAGRGAVGTG